ncbi:MAG: hypothetical protein K8S21_13540 [Gemmatimonadetes bacterium]|nr:hypothetical protein [Gemmatimonadota bacterium]
MPTIPPPGFRHRLRLTTRFALGCALALLSCGRDVTGPGAGLRMAQGISFVAQFPGPIANVVTGAGSVVPFDRVRVIIRRSDGSVAVDRVALFSAGSDSVRLDLRVQLSPGAPAEGEPFALSLAYVNAVGDTVFRGGPVTVTAIPEGSDAEPTPPATVPLTYTGAGANAASVTIAPETLTVLAGSPFTFTAVARTAQQAAVPAAPLIFSSLDTVRARINALGAGAGVARDSRGVARIAVALAAGGGADTAVLVVLPRPSALSVVSGSAQTAPAGALLADSVRVRLLATDGLGISGAPLTIAVTTGGGTVSAGPVVTNVNGQAAFAWTLGALVGAQSVTISAAGVTDAVVAATAADAPLVATQLVITQAINPLQVAGANTTPALRVSARDAAGVPVPGFTDSVTIALGANPGGAALGGTLRVAAVAGVATFSAWNVSAVGTGYTVVASASGLASATTAPFDVGGGGAAFLTVVSGDAQTGFVGQSLAAPVVVRVTDAFSALVAGVAVNFALTGGGGALTGASTVTNAAGTATLGSWTLGATPGANGLSVSVDGLAPLSITATGVLPPPAIDIGVVGSNIVGFLRAGTLNVRLLQPAPAGGLTVSIVSNSPAVLSIAAPGTIAFAAGQTLRTIEVSGLTLGTATVIGTAPGYSPDTLLVPVSLNLISLPPTLNVPLAQTQSLPVQLSSPAPAGGVAVAITSSNPAVARPLADTVFIAAGAQSVNATIEGLGLGSATFTATNANFALDRSVVSVTAALNIVATSVALNGGFGSPITVRLESGGSPVGAPAGGVPLTLTSANSACATVTPTSTIAAGLVSVALDVTYGGSAPLPCTTRVLVAGPAGFAPDSITANVAAFPVFNRAASSVGSGLQRSIGATLSAANHPGVTVRVTSLDSSIVLVAPTVATAGTGSYETAILAGATSIPLVISSVAGRIADTVAVRLEAPGFTTSTFSVYVWQPVVQLTALAATATTLSADDPFYVSVGTPSTPAGTSILNPDDVRRGGGPVTVTLVNDSARVGTLVTALGSADSLTVVIAEGVNNAPTSVATGGAAFRPLAAGVATIRTKITGFRALALATGTVTVSQPTISLAADYLGSGLQRGRTISTPGSPAPLNGTPITLTAARTGVVQFAPNATTAGADTLTVVIPAGATSTTFFVQAADGIVGDTVAITATSPGYVPAVADQRIWRAVYQLTGLNATGTPFTADDPFYVSIGSPNSPTGTVIWSADDRRFGAAPFDVSIVNSAPAVGTLVRTAGVTDSTVVPLAAGLSNTPTTVATGGVAMRYLTNGVSTVRATIPGAGVRALAAATVNVTVNSTALGIAADYIGSGLQRARSVTLSAPAPAGGVPVWITADRLGVVQFAPNATTLGADSILVTIAAGATSASFFVQGVEGIVADTVLLTATSPGFASGSGEQRVWQGVLELSGLPATLTTLAPDDVFQVFVGTPASPTGTQIWVADNIRFGAPPLVASIVSGTSTVGQLVTTAVTGDTVTVQLPAGGRVSPTTVALGGVAFQSLTTGTTVVSAGIPNFRAVNTAAGQTVTITAPALALGAPASVGSGLQVSAGGSVNAAQHGGINVIVRSANPGLVRVAPSAAVVATDSIIIPLANGTASFTYFVAAEDQVTGQASITARATGFTDAATTATVVAPAIQLGSLTATQAAFANDDPFLVQIGVPVANNSILSASQARRAGAAPLVVTLSSSNAAVGTLVTTGLTRDTLTVQILAGASASVASVAAGGVAFRALSPGTTTVRVTHPIVASTITSGASPVTVTTPVVTLAAVATVGAGLQVAASGSVSTPQHGGIGVVIRSADPTRVRVARLATDVATDSIVIPLANGVTAFTYVVAGIEGTTGTASITANAPAFTGAAQTATVVAPRIDISGLVVSRIFSGADDPFQVRIGIPNGTNASLTTTQALRAGAAPLVITITSATPSVGTLVTTALTGGTVTVQIVAGQFASAATVALGGVAFDYVAAGTTVVTISAGAILPTTTTGTATVTVTP